MTALVRCVALLLAAVVAMNAADAQTIYIPNKVHVFISTGGRVVLSDPFRTGNAAQSRWVFLNYALAKNCVYNFDNGDITIVPGVVDSLSLSRKADYVATLTVAPIGGTYPAGFIDTTIHLPITVYMWKDLTGCIVAHRLGNIAASQKTGLVSMEFFPRVNNSYTGHVIRWLASDSIAIASRTGFAGLTAVKALNAAPVGVKLSSGTTFFVSGTDPDVQPDSIRYNAATYTAFDASVDSGAAARSIIHVNLGQTTINASDSTEPYYFAYAFDTTEARTVQSIDALEAKYLATFVTSVKPITESVPAAFALEQNFPNPFNPSTTIRFDVKGESPVSLKVFDVLGRQVRDLVNGRLTPGTYQVEFNAVDLPSGVYFYRLQAGSFTRTLNMLLTK